MALSRGQRIALMAINKQDESLQDSEFENQNTVKKQSAVQSLINSDSFAMEQNTLHFWTLRTFQCYLLMTILTFQTY